MNAEVPFAQGVIRTGGWITGKRNTRALLLFAILLLSGLYLLHYSQAKAFWGDESLTFFTIHHRSLAGLLRFQASTPVVLEPPSNDLLLWFCTQLFGYSRLVLRMPSLLLFLGLQLLLYRVTSLLGGYRAGLIAAASLVAVRFATYGAEARPYALLTMLTVAGLALWYQLRSGSRHASLLRVLLAATIAVAITCQFYGALMVLPILTAEAVLSISERRRPDLGIIATVIVGCLAIALDVPFLHAVRAYRPPATHQINVSVQGIWVTYVEGFFVEPKLLLAMHLHLLSYARLALLIGVLFSFPLLRDRLPGAGPLPVRRALWAAFLVLTAYPAIALVLAVFVTHTWNSRYGIQCILALVALLSTGLARLLQRAPTLAVLAVGCAGLAFLHAQCTEQLADERGKTEALTGPFRLSPATQALLAQHPTTPIYLTIDECLLYPFYGDQAYQPRVRCLYSEGLEDRYDHSIMSSLTAIVMADHTDLGLPATCYQALHASGTGILAFSPHPWLLWVPESLQDAGASLTPVGSGFGGNVFWVTVPPGNADAAPCQAVTPTA